MDEMFRLLWERYRAWADTSARLKRVNGSWKRNVLVLTIGGTALTTLGPFAGSGVGRALPMLGAAALALATYFGKELLDAKHEEQWTRARAAAEALKSEAHKYAVQAPPYDVTDRMTRLKSRMAELSELTKNQLPDPISPDRAAKDMPTTWWTIDDYITKRIDGQITFYSDRAVEYTDAMRKGRLLTLTLGGLAVLLSAVTGATTEGAGVAAAILGVVTTAGGSIGAYFQAGHYEAIALKYRATADALKSLKAEFRTAPTPQAAGDLVTNAEAIMQAEHAAWLTEMTSKAAS